MSLWSEIAARSVCSWATIDVRLRLGSEPSSHLASVWLILPCSGPLHCALVQGRCCSGAVRDELALASSHVHWAACAACGLGCPLCRLCILLLRMPPSTRAGHSPWPSGIWPPGWCPHCWSYWWWYLDRCQDMSWTQAMTDGLALARARNCQKESNTVSKVLLLLLLLQAYMFTSDPLSLMSEVGPRTWPLSLRAGSSTYSQAIALATREFWTTINCISVRCWGSARAGADVTSV